MKAHLPAVSVEYSPLVAIRTLRSSATAWQWILHPGGQRSPRFYEWKETHYMCKCGVHSGFVFLILTFHIVPMIIPIYVVADSVMKVFMIAFYFRVSGVHLMATSD